MKGTGASEFSLGDYYSAVQLRSDRWSALHETTKQLLLSHRQGNNVSALMNQAKKFGLGAYPPGHSFTAPTVALSENRFLTVYFHGNLARNIAAVSGVFWHLENLP